MTSYQIRIYSNSKDTTIEKKWGNKMQTHRDLEEVAVHGVTAFIYLHSALFIQIDSVVYK